MITVRVVMNDLRCEEEEDDDDYIEYFESIDEFADEFVDRVRPLQNCGEASGWRIYKMLLKQSSAR